MKAGEALNRVEVSLEPAPHALDPRTVDESCQRQVIHDSIQWRCACGASGPVGRSEDGIPFVSEEMLRHQPGETKGAS